MVATISMAAARAVMLAAQGLDGPPAVPATKGDVLAVIRRMHLLQIDTIHVVARSPYLVLWSRLGDYPPEWLDELLAEGALFEYWAHAMCFLPIEDYPLYRRRMLDAMQQQRRPMRWALAFLDENPAVVALVREQLRQYGEARSADFDNTSRPAGGWWSWKAEKDALEALFLVGEVMIARRQSLQRVYAPRERVLPNWDVVDPPSSETLCRIQHLRAVQALGVALPAWVPDYFRQLKSGVAKHLQRLADEGALLTVTVDGLDGPAYVHPDNLGLLERAAAGTLEPTLTTLLSPFDPLVWDRDRASQLFGFDYRIECYTPAAKRRYGYFSLPILHRGQLVGRLDPKAHRAQGVFEVKALHLEPGVAPSQRLITDLADALRRLALWHATPEVVVRRSDPPAAAGQLARAVAM